MAWDFSWLELRRVTFLAIHFHNEVFRSLEGTEKVFLRIKC
jgi:hypothetical protein